MIVLSANMNEGLVILFVGMFVVFMALLVLFGFFSLLPMLMALFTKKPAGKKEEAASSPSESYTSGEQIAAVSTAIYLFLEEAHDEENAIVTINSVAKNYSPWSSKIYVTHRFNNK